MLDLLTEAESAQAREQGWDVYRVYDTSKRKWSAVAMPLTFNKAVPHVTAMNQELYSRARRGDSLATRALTLIARSSK